MNVNSLDSSDRKFSAIITDRVSVNGSTSRFIMTSTLTIRPPLVNGTTVECEVNPLGQIIKEVVNITLSGTYNYMM